MITGTAYFKDLKSAISYYANYGYGVNEVEQKIKIKEIYIGKPSLKRGEKLLLIDDGLRYAIAE